MNKEEIEKAYDENNILAYAQSFHKQSEIIKDINKSVVKMISENKEFIL